MGPPRHISFEILGFLISVQRFLPRLDVKFPGIFVTFGAQRFGTFHRGKPYWNNEICQSPAVALV